MEIPFNEKRKLTAKYADEITEKVKRDLQKTDWSQWSFSNFNYPLNAWYEAGLRFEQAGYYVYINFNMIGKPYAISFCTEPRQWRNSASLYQFF